MGLGKGLGKVQCLGSGIWNEEHRREFPYRNKGCEREKNADLRVGINGETGNEAAG